MNLGAIILCGGRSSRMDVDKALLPIGNETMLERTVRIVRSIVTRQVVVVAAADQQLPSHGVTVLRDSTAYEGPLAAIACGFAALAPDTTAAFVTGCDTPLLKPAIIEFLFNQLGDKEAVVPQDGERLYPLCAVYRTELLSRMDHQIATGERSMHQFIQQLDARLIPLENLRVVDADLFSFKNVNSREDYLSVLEVAGLSTP